MKEERAVPHLIFEKIPEAVSILEHTKRIYFVFLRVEFKRIFYQIFLGNWLSILNVDIFKSKLIKGFIWVFCFKFIYQLFEFIIYCFIDASPLCNFLFSFLNSFNVLFELVNFAIVLPEHQRVCFDLINCFAYCQKLTKHFKIISSKQFAHVDEFKKVSLIPICEPLPQQGFF